MTNLLLLSDHVKPVARSIRFFLVVCGRFFIILFRWRKHIELVHLEYAKKYLFDKSYLIIHYKFKNALWYNFKSIKKTTENKIIILNLQNVPVMPIELTVHGFFRSKTFYISAIPESTIENRSFKIAVQAINGIEIFSKPIEIKEIKPVLTLSKIQLNHTEIQIKQPSYTQTDFL